MFYKFIVIAALMFLTSCACTFSKQQEAREVYDLIQHTVQIKVSYKSIFQQKIDGENKSLVLPTNGFGTGVVVAIDKNKNETLILTNNHVCHIPETVNVTFTNGEVKKFNVISSETEIRTFNGKRVLAKAIYQDVTQDLCILKAKEKIGKAVVFAKKTPHIGTKVVYVGAPVLTFGPGLAFIGDGRILGSQSRGNITLMFLSVPVAKGASGSGVFYNNELIGLICAVNPEFSNASLAIQLSQIKNTISEAKKIWK